MDGWMDGWVDGCVAGMQPWVFDAREDRLGTQMEISHLLWSTTSHSVEMSLLSF
jgi:hypothetical protein